ncbi:MAG: hypothetical protein DRP09_11065 [Candidatus Thorarchaeota archaeon]|nr:MAG: hypothetical protein DRP09_11065 [Candidatus Thorarchaeota archaeon]
MSATYCFICETNYDMDNEPEHNEMCKENEANKEAADIVMLIRDAVGELDQWSAHNDDKYNSEVGQILTILHKMEAK